MYQAQVVRVATTSLLANMLVNKLPPATTIPLLVALPGLAIALVATTHSLVGLLVKTTALATTTHSLGCVLATATPLAVTIPSLVSVLVSTTPPATTTCLLACVLVSATPPLRTTYSWVVTQVVQWSLVAKTPLLVQQRAQLAYATP